MELDKLLEKVNDEQSFIEFAKALQADKEDEEFKVKANPANPYSQGCYGWESNTINQFLDSAIAYTQDNTAWKKETNLWKKFAYFLYGGKVYEQ